MVVRDLTTAYFVAVVIRLGRHPVPTRRVFDVLEWTTFVIAGFATSYFMMANGGLASTSSHFVISILVAQGIAMPRSWTHGLKFTLSTFGAFMVGCALLALMMPTFRSEFLNPALRGLFLMECITLSAAAALIVVGGHFVWSLRRETYESKQVGRFRLEERIAVGAMGEIWTAYHGALRRKVAIKLLRGRRFSAKGARERFSREADALIGLTHPNTVQILDRGVTDEGALFFAMEYVDGETLFDRVARLGPISETAAAAVVLQISKSLAEAHSKNIVHRDIHPGNVLLTQIGGETEFVKVIDFGIAKVSDPGDPDRSVQSTAAFGSPRFMSPERLHGLSGDARSDVFAIGAVFYFLLTGKAPLDANSTTAAIHQALAEILPPSHQGVTLRPELEHILLKCLSAKPDARFADAGALLSALNGVI